MKKLNKVFCAFLTCFSISGGVKADVHQDLKQKREARLAQIAIANEASEAQARASADQDRILKAKTAIQNSILDVSQDLNSPVSIQGEIQILSPYLAEVEIELANGTLCKLVRFISSSSSKNARCVTNDLVLLQGDFDMTGKLAYTLHKPGPRDTWTPFVRTRPDSK